MLWFVFQAADGIRDIGVTGVQTCALPISKAIQNAKGVLWYKGVGEWPLVQQATFSLWNSLEEVKDFAYKSSHHAAIVKKTRKRNWYKEDLFARFAVRPLPLNNG